MDDYTSASDRCDPISTLMVDRGCMATAINAAGYAVGFIGEGTIDVPKGETPFLASPTGHAVILPHTTITSAVPRAINAGNQIVGCQTIDGSCDGAIEWASPGLGDEPLVLMGGQHAVANDINDSGDIVGSYDVAGQRQAWSIGIAGGPALLLQPPTSWPSAQARAINTWGLKVGWATNSAGSLETAVMWQGGAQAIDLNSLLADDDRKSPSNPGGWYLRRAYDVDDRGDIVGVGVHGHQTRGFLLRVVPLVVIPGTSGSFLNRSVGDTNVWLGCGSSLSGNRDYLSLSPDDAEPALYASDVVRRAFCSPWPIALTDGHDTLLRTLAANGYRAYDSVAHTQAEVAKRTPAGCVTSDAGKGPNLFVFPYDWRQDIAGTNGLAAQLGQYVQCLQKFFPDGRGVAVLAHSMGNLIVRRYQIDNPANAIETSVSIAPPWWGAYAVPYFLMTGDFIPCCASGPGTRHAMQTMPSVYELHPSQSLLHYDTSNPSHSAISAPDPGSSARYPFWGPNIPLSFEQEQAWFTTIMPMDYNAHTYTKTDVLGLNATFHAGAQDDFHGDTAKMRRFVFSGAVAASRGSSTPALDSTPGPAYWDGRVWRHSMTTGDDTVPLVSAEQTAATRAPDTTVFRCTGPKSEVNGYDAVSHVLLLRNREVIGDALKAIAGQAITAGPECNLLAGLPIGAPIRRAVVGPEVVGSPPANSWEVVARGVSDLQVGDSDNSTQLYGLAGVSVEQPGDGTAVADVPTDYPNDVTVSFVSKGPGGTLDISTAANGGEAWRWLDIAAPTGTTEYVTLTTTGPKDYGWDIQGVDYTPTPVVLTGASALDTDPPHLAVCAQKSGAATVYNIRAVDSGSAIADSRYSTDGTAYHDFSTPLNLDPATTPTLWAYADDSNANRSPVVQTALSSLSTTPDLIGSAPVAGPSDTFATVTIQLPCTSALPVNVTFSTADGSAIAGHDYTATSATLTFAPGEDTKTVQIPILATAAADGDALFYGVLSSATNANVLESMIPIAIGARTALSNPTIGITNSLTITQPLTGTAIAKLNVTLAAASAVAVTVHYATSDGTAQAGRDYTAESGTLTIRSGETVATIEIPVLASSVAHNPRNFTVSLSDPTNAILGTSTGTVTLTSQGETIACHVATITWDGAAGDGKWSTAGNWTPARVPGTADDVCINTGAGVTVDLAAEVASIEAHVPLTIQAHLQLSSTTQGSTFGADTVLDGSTNASLDVAGTLDLTDGTFTWGQNVPVATMDWTSSIGGTGTVIVHTGASLVAYGGLCRERFDLTAPGYLGGCLQFTPTLHNEGTVTIASGWFLRDSVLPVVNNGILKLGDDLTDSANAVSQVAGGCIGLTPCDPFPLINGGTITRTVGPDVTHLSNTLLTNAESGSVVLDGSLEIDNQSWIASLPGTWTVTAPAKLILGGTGALTLPTGASVTGTGTLQLMNTGESLDLFGTLTVAHVAVDHGGTLTFENSTTLNSLEVGLSATVGGPGSITLPTLSPPDAPATLTMNGGTLALVGDLTVASSAIATWNSGKLAGPGATTIAAGGTLHITAAPGTQVLSRRLVNNGTVVWSMGTIQARAGASVVNAGTWSLLPSSPIAGSWPRLVDQSSGSLTFTNTGLLSLYGGAGGSGGSIDGIANSTGAIDVTAGVLTLRPPPGVTSRLAGGASVASGAKLELIGATPGTSGGAGGFVLPPAASLTGAGTLSINTNLNGVGGASPGAGLTVELAGTDNLPGLTIGTAAVGTAATLTADTPLSLSGFTLGYGCTLSGVGSVTVVSGGIAKLTGVNSQLAGSGTFLLASGATGSWSGGSMTGTGSTVIDGTLNILPPVTRTPILSRRLVNNGTVVWSMGTIQARAGASVVNAGTWSLLPSSPIAGSWPRLVDQSSGSLTFTNTGLLSLYGGAGGSGGSIDGIANSTGAIDVTAGVLTLRPPPGVTSRLAGGASVASGAKLELIGATPGTSGGAGGFVLPPAASLTGAGTLSINTNLNGVGGASPGAGLTVELAGTDNLPGLTIGTASIAAILKIDTQSVNVSNYTQGASGTLVTTFSSDGNGRINASGTAIIAGTIAIALNGTYEPSVGTSFTVVTAPTVSGLFAHVTNPVGETFIPVYAQSSVALRRAT